MTGGLVGEPGRELDRMLREAQSEFRLPSVSAAVFRAGEVVWEEAVGLADAEAGRPATSRTQYRLGSITKTFTAVAVMRLRDQGRLALDDHLSAHLGDLAGPDLTVRQLLSHLSGLQREPLGTVWEEWDFPSLERLLEDMPRAERVLPAGVAWHYSNLAFALLGEVVARLSGRPWEEEIAASLLRPLGLAETTAQPLERAAHGYFVDPHADRLHLMPPVDIGGIAAAGQLWSTTGDLARWGAFLAHPPPEILSPDATAEMHSVQVMADEERWTRAWGLGLILHRREDDLYAGHDGGMPGFLASLVYSRRDRTGAAVLANTESGLDPAGLALGLTRRWLEMVPPPPEPWTPGPPVPEAVEPLLGSWWSEGLEFIFSHRRGRLEARRADAPAHLPPAAFEPAGPDTFRTVSGRERGEWLRAIRDPAGAVTKLYWATYPFTREPRG